MMLELGTVAQTGWGNAQCPRDRRTTSSPQTDRHWGLPAHGPSQEVPRAKRGNESPDLGNILTMTHSQGHDRTRNACKVPQIGKMCCYYC